MSNWIFLSAHFDDVVLSAGGLVWELTQQGEVVEVCTIMAGDAPTGQPLSGFAQALHSIWQLGDDVPWKRSAEDAASCGVLGASYRRCTIPDCIYRADETGREALVNENDDLFKPPLPGEERTLAVIADFLRKNIPAGAEVVAPLAIGGHRDHVLTRRAAEQLGMPLWHYVDYPYMIQKAYRLSDWVPAKAEEFRLDITPAGLQAWQDGFEQQRSQVALFWKDTGSMRQAISDYLAQGWGNCLWRF